MEIRPETCRIARLAKELSDTLRPVAEKKNLAFRIDVAPDCPATIDTDRQRLEQVLKNLLSNAFKFTEQGKVELTARRAADGQIAFAVSRHRHRHIRRAAAKLSSRPFRQADGTISRKYGGTGPWPLDLARACAPAWRGDARYEAAEGAGQHFHCHDSGNLQPVTGCPAGGPPAAAGRAAADPSRLARHRRSAAIAQRRGRPRSADWRQARAAGRRGR